MQPSTSNSRFHCLPILLSEFVLIETKFRHVGLFTPEKQLTARVPKESEYIEVELFLRESHCF